MRLLLAEDARLVREPLVHALRRAGWAVDVAADGERALELALSVAYDAVVLDIMLPALDGLSVLREIRAASCGVPVVLLTARSDVRDRVRGLNMGADDYLPKPFHVQELIARLGAVTRRHAAAPAQTFEACGLVLDPVARQLVGPRASIGLTGKEALILEALMRRAGGVVPRRVIEEAAWGAGPGSPGRLEAQISSLRTKLGRAGAHARIEAVRGVGYVLGEASNA